MGTQLQEFYRNHDDWDALRQRLKHTPCPHCQVVGMLIGHGVLRGYDDRSRQRTVRAQRLFCSNRQARRGCGRTFSVYRADLLRRRSVTTGTLWRFLGRAATGSLRAALRAADSHLSDRTWQRLWTRFTRAQSTLRTALLAQCPPPLWSPAFSATPAHHVLAHLQAAFPNADCPIAACQYTMGLFFV